jgi:hypothetical protein
MTTARGQTAHATSAERDRQLVAVQRTRRDLDRKVDQSVKRATLGLIDKYEDALRKLSRR